MALLDDVKTALGITGDYQDGTLQLYINEVKQFMIDGGVSSRVVNSSVATGIIIRGVADLWNYGAGSADLSPYFVSRVVQLAYKKDSEV